MREKAEYSASNDAAFMALVQTEPLAKNKMYGTAVPFKLTCPINMPSPYPKATSVMRGSAILPTTLGMASLRHTSRLRLNTGHQRMLMRGADQIDVVVDIAAVVITRPPLSVCP